MFAVHKYQIMHHGNTLISVPESAQALRAGLDLDNNLCVWCLVNPEEPPTEKALIATVYTGEQIPDTNALKYLGSCNDRGLISHTFLVIPPK